MMNRRKFVRTTSALSVTLGLNWLKYFEERKSHLITFSFDDGFKKSFLKAAEIHERYGTSGCFNVIASGHLPSFKAVDDWILPELLGDFETWNNLLARGHEVMPHTWEHLNLTKVSLEHAKENIDKCLEYFEDNLDAYENENAIFNYAFCASTPEIEKYTLSKVRAVRTGGWHFMDGMANEIPSSKEPVKLGCWTFGPKKIDKDIKREVDQFLKTDGGWLIFNVHGLDEEGWGPMSAKFYDKLLKRLTSMEKVAVLTPTQVFDKFI